MLVGQFALVVAALFTGAAAYINIAEHPARLLLNDGPLLTQWKPSYKRGFAMQSSLAVLGFVLGLGDWYLTGEPLWALGAIVLVANWPFTLLAIMPINNQLAAISPDSVGAEMRPLMEQWGRRHAVRTALGAASTLIFIWAMQ
ncbi:MAG: DUF1772 domain-containing protein [Rhodospirillaceae bacterium]|jgi:uncharacterized membrane protein|nr:DUF1772 domain-containing protein [Rhodospirillaceae bacterium]MBT5239353.1 DUF1772 domain-containing protein [Rhodospirillaceae bacterium]MBT5566371.1 DUF1772 domain-containing protein [Rhodospirillaceae bacterium]MBT6088464.1 DUF1772 domain-containing protein [Rhodospirillaceae bacterium]MBT6962115.1 DUF1772 domain-containing protein [Rhodospirillaceae bacterium]